MLGSFSPFLSCHENVETSASLCGSWMWRGEKIKRNSEAIFFNTAAYLSQVDFKLPPKTKN